jgi:dienelactone hydrolase
MRPRTRTRRPRLESLEDRSVPSTLATFDLHQPDGGPFPSDRFTVADGSQLTNRRINLPLPDASTHPSDYADVSVINTLDGFNLQPRLSISFSGPIDVTTVNSTTVFLVKLGDATAPEDGCGPIVGINQTVWDPATNTLHVESDELLDQHTRYALIVTRGVRDVDGEPIQAGEAFERFRHDLNFGQTDDPALKEYRKDLLGALEAAQLAGVAEADVVTASVFTTQSATAVLEKIRDQIHAATPAPADFLLGPGGERTVFDLGDVAGITWNQQTRGAGPLNPVPVKINLLGFVPGAVGQIAFGRYVSPDYETAEQFIPPVGTRTGTPVVQGVNEVFFNLYLPSGPRPAAGWPVAIFGHGVGGSKQGGGGGGATGGDSLALAASLAERGIATIAINVVGHGFGPLSTLTVTPNVGAPVSFPEGGRGIDQNRDGIIENNEGVNAAPPRSIIRDRDGQRQTVADLMQLVRVIEVGVDADGNGVADLDPSRIYYLGQSLGGIYGTEFLAVEPDVHAGVLNVAGGLGGNNRLSPIFRAAVGTSLASRTPSLLNGPGVTSLDGVSVLGRRFDENMPLRDGVPLVVRLADGTGRAIQSPVINTVPGAMPIQEVLEHFEWVSQSGDPMAYAPHIRKAPLAGVPAKSVIYQFAKGDQIVPNPTTTALLRAGDLADRATFYRHDLAFAENSQLPTNPHGFLATLDIPGFRAITRGAQEQVATFFATDGTAVIHPEPARFFETPVSLPLPESLNFILPPGPLAGLAVPSGNPPKIESVIVNDGSAQRSMVDSLTITFDRLVTFDPGAFGLKRQDGSAVGLDVAAAVVDGRTIAVLTFTGTDIIGDSLADGSYTLTIRGDHVRDEEGGQLDGDGDGVAGGDRAEDFFRLFGDSDADHDVDWQDRDLFRSALGNSAADIGDFWYFDFDGDGDVDGRDNGQLNLRFGQY